MLLSAKHILILAKPGGKLDDIITNMQISVIFIRYRTENNYIVYGFFLTHCWFLNFILNLSGFYFLKFL